MTRIVLASASPRRQALLAALGLTFDVITSDVAESCAWPPQEAVIANARAKRDDVITRLDAPALVIGADTLVALGEHVLAKPADAGEAKRMLRQLSGNTHRVFTGLAVTDTASGKSAQGFECTEVTFRALSDEEIDRFIEAVNPVDRAGAYTVDGPGSLLVEGYSGCYQNVLGLPIVRLDRLLRETGHNLFDLMHGPRAQFL